MLRMVEKMIKKRIIVSLTSYDKRLPYVPRVIRSLLSQSYKANKIVLYLEDKYKTDEVNRLFEGSSFEIRWVGEDLGPHKKYYYAFQEYPDDIVITVDDDIEYGDTLIQQLVDEYLVHPNAIIANRVHLMHYDETTGIAPYERWMRNCEFLASCQRMDLFATGCGGILYCPFMFPEETFNKTAILNRCKHADDVWLKIMEVKAGIPVVCTKQGDQKQIIHWIDEIYRDGLYNNFNRDGGNDVQLQSVLDSVSDDEYESIIKTLFPRGAGTNKEIDELEMEELNKNLLLFLSSATPQCFYIYGAGKVASRLYMFLKMNNKDEMVKGFLVNDTDNNPEMFFDKPVLDFRKTKDRGTVIVAVGKQNVVSDIIDDLYGADYAIVRPVTKNERKLLMDLYRDVVVEDG